MKLILKGLSNYTYVFWVRESIVNKILIFFSSMNSENISMDNIR